MANRRSTFLLKRSNIAGKIPAAGDLQLGELALNIADNILYASGTTANSILPIGWDRVARTGDTMTGNFNFFGDVAISGSSLPNGYALSVTGDTNFSGDMYVGGNLYYDGNTIIQSGLTASTIYTDYIDFNTGYTGQTLPAGRLQWDDGNGTLVLGLKGGTSNMEIGLENMALCFNDEATTLTAGTVVYVSGSQGNRPSIKRAIATSDGYSVTTLGIVSESIASGAEGFVTTFGMVNNLNTIGYSGGTAIWLSPTVSGAFTSVKPQAPQHTVLLGYVVRVHASVGSIFVHISNGWEIDELHDVRLNGRVEGDLLAYSAYNGSNVWVNTKTLNGSYTMTGLTVNGNVSIPSVTGATIDTDKFLVSDSGVVKFRTGTQVLSDIGGVGGSGTADYVARFTGAKTLGDGMIQDNGSTVGINVVPAVDSLLYVSVNPPFLGTPEDYVIKAVNAPFGGLSTGLFGISSTVTNSAGGATSGTFTASSGSDDATAGVFNAVSTFAKTATGIIVSATGGTNNYSLQLQDNTEGINKVLISKTIDGKANWSSSLLGLTSVQTNALTVNGNIIVTGGTQSIFSGNSSSDLVRITQTGSGNAFVVEDSNNPDSSSFVIDANGSVGVGTVSITEKLNVNGNLNLISSTTTKMNIESGAGVRTYLASDGAGTSFGSLTNHNVVFYRNNSEFARMTSTGFGIGTTTPIVKLDVSGDTRITGTLTATTISATTYLNLPSSGGSFTGGTISGATDFTGGLSATTISATTYYNLPIDISVTGGTYTTGTATFTNNTGGTFSVTGMSTSGSNVGGGVGVFSGASGSTLVFKTLTSTASTITIQNNANTVNLETNAGVKVIPIATSSVSIGTGSNDYYLNFNAPYNMTIASITFSVSSNGSDNVRLAIYRGQDTTATLVGQSASSTVLTTVPTFTMTPESGQNLTFKAGEWMVIGVAVGGTTTNLYGSSCPATNSIAWTNTTDSTGGFPTNPRSKAGTRTSFPSIEINVV